MELSNLEPGSKILLAEPFAYAVNADLLDKFCEACMRSSVPNELGHKGPTLMTCGGCKLVRYCKRACQKSAWPGHRAECKYLANYLPPDQFVRLLFKVWVKLQNGDKEIPCHLPDGKTLTFFELPSFPGDINNDPEQKVRFFNIHSELCKFVGPDAPSRDEILPIYAILTRNEITMKNDYDHPQGSAIYLETSEFEHSCQFNTTFVLNGKFLLARYVGPTGLKGRVNIRRDLKVAYTGLLWDTPNRQKFLKDRFGTTCECLKCLHDPLEIDPFKQGCLKCVGCDGGAVPIPSSSEQGSNERLKCPDCQRNISTKDLETFWILKLKLQKIPDSSFMNDDGREINPIFLEDWKTVLEADKIMHCYDQDFLQSLMLVSAFELKSARYDSALDMCLKVVKALDWCAKVPSFVAAKAHYNICLAAKALGKSALLMKHAEKALDLLTMTHGPEHPLYSTLVHFEGLGRFGSWGFFEVNQSTMADGDCLHLSACN